MFPASCILSLLHESESVPAWRLSYEYVSLSVPVCDCGYLCVSLATALPQLFCEQHRKHPMGEEMRDSPQKHLTELHKLLSHLLQLNPTDVDNKQNYKYHCLSSNIQILCSALSIEVAFNIYGGYSFHNVVFNLYFCCSQQMIHMHYSEYGHGRVHVLRLQLCIGLSKS